MEEEALTGLRAQRQEREIDGVMYEAWPLPFRVGMPLLKRTLDIIAPIGSAVMAGGDKAVFDVLPTAFTDSDVSRFAKAFGANARVKEGDAWIPLMEAKQDLHFAGAYPRFMKWLLFCMEVNFSGFTDGETGKISLASLIKKMQ
jgi:hypothetical protein